MATQQRHFESYKDTAGYWRWRLVASNGEIVAVSSESYNTEQGILKSVKWVQDYAASSPLV